MSGFLQVVAIALLVAGVYTWHTGRDPLQRPRSVRVAIGIMATGLLLYAFVQPSNSDPAFAEPALEEPSAASGVPADAFTTTEFEASALFAEQSLLAKDSWDLNSGGTNYLYRFDNPGDPGESFTVELSPAADNVTSVSVLWPGDLPESRLDPHEEQFLRDLLALFEPTAGADEVVAFVRANVGKDYPGGSNDMPREAFGDLKVYAGNVLQTLVGLEK